MMDILPVLLKDGYKIGHKFQYPVDTEYVYSNITPRTSRVKGVNSVVTFGVQYFIKEYLQRQFDDNFFYEVKHRVMEPYKRRIDHYLGHDAITYDHIEALHDLGYLPLKIKALPEGTVSPIGVPVLTIVNTKPEFFWLTNMVETLMSCVLWKPITSATTAHVYRQRFDEFAEKTGGSKLFVPWQGHDFSFRGMSGVEDACLSGAAHLLSFTGTDTIPAIDFLEHYYGADCEKELIGGSVPATEHSVMSMGLPENELDTFNRLITEVYPKGIVSIVSDTWDFWNVIDEMLPKLKSVIMSREGKVVIRPDSGDPVKIICGEFNIRKEVDYSRHVGAIQRLWEIFGGIENAKGFKELDRHIGLIYGDSITLDRQRAILEGLAAKGFASTNVVLGLGSYTYQYVTRDTFGQAMKATWGKTKKRGAIAIYKDPKTDYNLMKRSHRGLLSVVRNIDGKLVCLQDVTPEQEEAGELKVVFKDGELYNEQTLADIRKRLEADSQVMIAQ